MQPLCIFTRNTDDTAVTSSNISNMLFILLFFVNTFLHIPDKVGIIIPAYTGDQWL